MNRLLLYFYRIIPDFKLNIVLGYLLGLGESFGLVDGIDFQGLFPNFFYNLVCRYSNSFCRPVAILLLPEDAQICTIRVFVIR